MDFQATHSSSDDPFSDPTSAFIQEMTSNSRSDNMGNDSGPPNISSAMGADPAVAWMTEEVMATNGGQAMVQKGREMAPNPFLDSDPVDDPTDWLMSQSDAGPSQGQMVDKQPEWNPDINTMLQMPQTQMENGCLQQMGQNQQNAPHLVNSNLNGVGSAHDHQNQQGQIQENQIPLFDSNQTSQLENHNEMVQQNQGEIPGYQVFNQEPNDQHMEQNSSQAMVQESQNLMQSDSVQNVQNSDGFQLSGQGQNQDHTGVLEQEIGFQLGDQIQNEESRREMVQSNDPRGQQNEQNVSENHLVQNNQSESQLFQTNQAINENENLDQTEGSVGQENTGEQNIQGYQIQNDQEVGQTRTTMVQDNADDCQIETEEHFTEVNHFQPTETEEANMEMPVISKTETLSKCNNLEVSNENKEDSDRTCKISQIIPNDVSQWASDKGGVTSMLLTCSKENYYVPVYSLVDSGSVAGDKEAGFVSANIPASSWKYLETKVIVLKRCGVKNEDLKNYTNYTICHNHMQLLTCQFPLQEVCQLCHKKITIGKSQSEITIDGEPTQKLLTAVQQDVLRPFHSGAILGQPICEGCAKKINLCMAKRSNKSERSFARVLRKMGLITEDKYLQFVNDLKPIQGLSGPDYPTDLPCWVSICKLDPFHKEPPSIVPSLRLLSRGVHNNVPVPSSPEISVREMVELRLMLKNISRSQLDLQHAMASRLVRLGILRTFYEFKAATDFFIAATDRMEAMVEAKKEDDKQRCGFSDKLRLLYGLAASQVLLYPDDCKEATGNILYRDASGNDTILCLTCPKSGCRGCKEFGVAPPAKDAGVQRHDRLLAVTCRLCKKTEKSVHRCKDLKVCEAKVCKVFFKDDILKFYGFDVFSDSYDVHPSKLCGTCRNNFINNKVELNEDGSKLEPAEFEPHGTEACDACEYNLPLFATTYLEEATNDRLVVKYNIGSVPSLKSLATGFLPNIKSVWTPNVWQHLTVASCMDISSTVAEYTIVARHYEAFEMLLSLLRKNILLGTSRFAFTSKVRFLYNLIKHLQDKGSEEYQDEMPFIHEKIRYIMALKFFNCDPWFKKFKNRIGIKIYHDSNTEFLCCQCPYFDCDGGCLTPVKPIPKITCSLTSKQRAQRRKKKLEEENEALSMSNESPYDNYEESIEVENDFEDPFYDLEEGSCVDSISSSEDLMQSTDNNHVEISYYYTSATSTDLTFDFVHSDYIAVHDYLVCQSDPAYWTVKESTDELSLLRGDKTVNCSIKYVKQKQRTICTFSGSAMNNFVEELLPALIKMTSSKYRDLGEILNGDEDASMTTPEFVHVNAGIKDENKVLRRNDRTPPSSLKCRGCKTMYRSENALVRHEANCRRAGIPADIVSYPSLSDGRKPCPGCNRAFVDTGISYLKHIRQCSKIKIDGFPCSTCNLKFSTSKTLGMHSKTCLHYRKRQGGIIMPQITKKLKIESVVSLQSNKKPRTGKTNGTASGSSKVKKSIHEIICKTGDYQCPICKIRFKLNQAYGKHLKNQDCVKKKPQLNKIVAPEPKDFTFMYITIYPGIEGDDSIVGYNRIPNLRWMCRGVQMKKCPIKPKQLPALTIKEGLEIFYSIKRSDKSLDKDVRWKYLNDRNIFHNYGSWTAFNNSANSVLKQVNHFEEKVKSAKSSRNKVLMKKWNDKLNVFLAMPYHDNFNTITVSKFKAFEYPSKDGNSVEVICFNCPEISCRGCHQTKVIPRSDSYRPPTRQNPVKPVKLNPITPKILSRNNGLPMPASKKQLNAAAKNKRKANVAPPPPPPAPAPPTKRNGSPQQLAYYSTFNIWLTKEQMKKEAVRIGKLLNYRRPASINEIIKFEIQNGKQRRGVKSRPGPASAKANAKASTAAASAVRMAHYCPDCSRSFDSSSRLQAHQRVCNVAARLKSNPAISISRVTSAKPRPVMGPKSKVGPASKTRVVPGPKSRVGPAPKSRATPGPKSRRRPTNSQSDEDYKPSVKVQRTPTTRTPTTITPSPSSSSSNLGLVSSSYTTESSTTTTTLVAMPADEPIENSMPWMMPAVDCEDEEECILPD